jgi:NitT/TauT family transport system permease protein
MPSWVFAIRGRVPQTAAVVMGAVPLVVLLFVWWLYTRGAVEERWISPTILPSPGEVFGYLPTLLAAKDSDGGNALLHHIVASFRRVGFGFLLALAVVVPLGVAMGAFGGIRALFTPTMTASGYIPISTLVPLTMSWFGTSEEQKCIFLAMAFGIYLMPMVVKAIDGVPDVYIRTAYTLGASRRQVVFRVLFPIAAPDLWHALRLAFGVGWTYIVLTEALVQVDGLGFLVQIGFRRGPREQIYLAIIIITAIAWVADLGWERLGRLLFPYRRPR